MRRVAAVLSLLGLLAACSDNNPFVAPTPTQGTSSTSAASGPPPVGGALRLVTAGTFQSPLQVVAVPGDPRVFVVQQSGEVRILRDGRIAGTPFLDISDQVSNGNEQGLLSLAFAPDYATSGLAYVNYTDRTGDTRVVEYRVDAASRDRLDPSTRREVLHVPQPFSNHNGGLVLFDPSGMLVVGMGDGGSGNDPGNRAQNLDDLLGKLLRIDPRKPSGDRAYGIPADNPFVGRRDARPEILAYGLRNPWRFSYAADGALWLGDVGQNAREEIDLVPPAALPGANFGWRRYEGDRVNRGGDQIDETRLVRPVAVLDHGNRRCSITGGLEYTGRLSALKGRYLFGDVCSGEVFAMRRGEQPQRLPFTVDAVVSFGLDSAGELYAVSLAGSLVRITDGA